MKVVIATLVLFATAFFAHAGTAESVQFTGFVARDNGTPVRFDIQVPAKQHTIVELNDGSKLTLAAPGDSGDPTAAARLVSASGETLHTATFSDPSLASTSLAYLICGAQVTYFSPAPSSVPSCPQG